MAIDHVLLIIMALAIVAAVLITLGQIGQFDKVLKTVLTRLGESFASRVAASLLHAVGLPKLITTTPEEYEALAINLATHPDQLKRIKAELAQNLSRSPLFDSQRFARHLESAYFGIYERYQSGLPPDHMHVIGSP